MPPPSSVAPPCAPKHSPWHRPPSRLHTAPWARPRAAACFQISEGLDFSDKAGRAVIITGIPYANNYDAKVRVTPKCGVCV
eukprot:357959-Chlamydomonas_euryale.AAC.1